MSEHTTDAQSGSGLLEVGPRVTEQRPWPHDTTIRAAAIHSWPAGADGPEPALICGVSAGGLGLFVDAPVQPDTLFRVEFEDEAVQPRLARVVHAQEDEGGWLLGCALVDRLTEDELQALRLWQDSEQ
jgi:hypothetical protein